MNEDGRSMSKVKTVSQSQKTTVRFLKRYIKKWENYCNVADGEGMPKMKAFYSKRIKAAELIISVFSDNSPKPQDNRNERK